MAIDPRCLAWFDRHGARLEALLATAINDAMDADAHTPTVMVARSMARQAAAENNYSECLRSAASVARVRPVAERPPMTAETWTTQGWIGSLQVAALLEAAMLQPLGPREPESALAFVRQLGRLPAAEGQLAMSELLLAGGLLDTLAAELQRGAAALAQATAASGQELHQKFLASGSAFELSFGSLEQYFGGLEKLIGAPNPKLSTALKAEHVKAADSAHPFTTPNYAVTTTSRVEYYFVADPIAGLAELGIDDWPVETQGDAAIRRRPEPPAAFAGALATVNDHLEDVGVAALLHEEFLGARLCAWLALKPGSHLSLTCARPAGWLQSKIRGSIRI